MIRIAIVIFMLSFTFAIKAQTFVLNSALLASHQTAKVINGLPMLVEVFGSLGLEIEFRYRPNKRSITETNNGVADGEFARIASIAEDYPNVIVVPEPLAQLDIVAFCNGPEH